MIGYGLRTRSQDAHSAKGLPRARGQGLEQSVRNWGLRHCSMDEYPDPFWSVFHFKQRQFFTRPPTRYYEVSGYWHLALLAVCCHCTNSGSTDFFADTEQHRVHFFFAVSGTWSLASVRRSAPRIACRSLICVLGSGARFQQTACFLWPQGITWRRSWDFTRALGLDIADKLAMCNNPSTQVLSMA